MEEASAGLCHCGCGEPTLPWEYNDASQGRVKGEPRRYIYKHGNRLKGYETGYKTCTVCKISKPFTDFYKNSEQTSASYTRYKSECKPCKKKKNYEWLKNNPENNRKYANKYKYGITEKDFKKMLSDQNMSCAVCQIKFKSTSHAHIDHCHIENKVRGLLCGSCNRALGLMKDNIESLSRAIKYLEESGREAP